MDLFWSRCKISNKNHISIVFWSTERIESLAFHSEIVKSLYHLNLYYEKQLCNNRNIISTMHKSFTIDFPAQSAHFKPAVDRDS